MDADELDAADGWDCESPSAALADEFAWGDDDDAVASPMTQPPALGTAAVGAAGDGALPTSGAPPQEAPAPRSATSFSDQATRAALEASSFAAAQGPPLAAPTEAQQEERWDEDWDQHDAETAAAEVETTVETTVASAATVATTAATTSQAETVAAPVELTSPGAAAGEFWGDGDEDELFDHDDHADEEWDESIKGQASSQQGVALHSSEESKTEPALTFTGQDAPFPRSTPPPPPTASIVAAPPKEEEAAASMPEVVATTFEHSAMDHVEDIATSSTQELVGQSPAITEEAATSGSSALPPPPMERAFSVETTPVAKPTTSLDAGSSPFSSALAKHASQDDGPSVYPEAPRSARFLHTPTGTGGPFGRVPSPQGNDNSSFQDEFSSATTLTGQDTQRESTALAAGEKNEASGSYTESNVRWDARADGMPSEEHASHHDSENRFSARHGQSDEEERDSVVSFSGENSFFPSAGRPSSLYGGSQSSFASHRMYQSSIASTDHDGSSIASYGVSSAGATFGGSERVSEGGAFSDGTVSETPSIVDSSNASTAFGTDFPSVSEGQFSAPGTAIGGSDNASDGGFSDGNASETTSMCESVNTNPRFVSDFSASSGHYVTETVERRDVQESFAPSASDTNSAFGESEPAAATAIFGGDDSSADVNPFSSSPSPFPPSNHTTSAPPATASTAGGVAQEEGVLSAASLFGATAGADVPNPFSSFGAPPAPTAVEAKPTVEHELPTSDASDLFGSGAPSSGFDSSFAQPVHTSYGSSFQAQEQNYNQTGRGGYAGTSSAFNSMQNQFSSSSPFGSQSSNAYNTADPFASRGGAQNEFGNSVPSDDSMFRGGGGYNSGSDASSHFGGSERASADAMFSGHARADSSSAATLGHFGQQASAQTYNASYGGNQNSNQNAQDATAAYASQSSFGASAVPGHFRQQSSSSVDNYAHATASDQYGQTSGAGAGSSSAVSHFSRQSSSSSFTSGYNGQNRYGSQQADASASGTPDNYTHKSAAEAFASPAQPSYGSQQGNRFSSQQYGQTSSPGTSDNYSRNSATQVFGNASPVQPAYGSQHDSQHSNHQFGRRPTPGTLGSYTQHSAAEVFGSMDTAQQGYSRGQFAQSATQGQSAGFSDHTRSSSSASADAVFGQSSAAPEMGASSTASGGEHATTPSAGSIYQQETVHGHTQPSFSRSGSNMSSYGEQHSSHLPPSTTSTQTLAHTRDLNTSYGSIEETSFTRHMSSSSINRYGSEKSFEQPSNLHRHQESTSSHAPVDANSFFGGAPSATPEVTASSFFGSTAAQDSSDFQTTQSQKPNEANTEAQTASQYASPSQQEHEQQQQFPQAESIQHEFGGDYFGAGAATTSPSPLEVSPSTDVDATFSATPSENLLQHESGDFGNSANADPAGTAVGTQDGVSAHFAGQSDANQPQAFDGFADSSSQDFGIQKSSNFFSSSVPAPQATTTASTYQYEQNYDQETQVQQQQQHRIHDAAAASLQFAETRSSYQQPSAASHSTASPGNYFASSAPGAGASSQGSFSQQHQQQQQAQPQHQQYQQYQQQQEPQPHVAAGYAYHGGMAQTQSQRTGYNSTARHEFGATVGHGYAPTSAQASHPVANPAVKTSNKYKDPCVAPPSCLVSFGFGGNAVTMFPKRKLRLNIAGSGYRNSPRSPQAYFDNGGNGELRKGPVSVYHMDQLHPKDKEFEQMDNFPGPLTDDVSDEAILEYLDDRLKRSEMPTSADEAEDENDRLLLGILRILVKCNGKLRSDPGTLNPSDPNSPEAQLIMLLSENSKRRCGNQSPTFPSTRKAQAVTRVLRTYLDETYATGDPCRALFMSFADQEEKSVQEPKRLLQTNSQQSANSLILSGWVSHAQVLLANRTADTNKILTELGDRLWNESDAVAAAHICYLLAGIQVEAPMPSSKMALLGGDHRNPKEARFYVSPGAVQRTEIYEWAHKHSKGASANLMIPFQGYKLIYAMLLADHGKLDTAFKYVTSMLAVIKAMTATMKPGTSMYLEGMKNQLTVLDDRLRQHLGQDRVASVAASTSRGGGRKQGGKWGLGSALSIMGKIVNRVVEGNDSAAAAPAGPSATTPGGLYASEATPPAASYPSNPSVTAPTSSPAPSYPQQHVQQTPPTSSHGPSPVPLSSYGHATPPASQGSAPGSSNGYNRAPAAPPAGPYSRPTANAVPPSGPFSGNGRLGPQQQQTSGPFSGNGKPAPSGPYSNSGPPSRGHGTVPLMRSQHSMEPPGSNHSTHSNSSFHGMPPTPMNPPQHPPQQQQQPPLSQSSQHSQDTPTARPAFQKPAPIDVSHDDSLSQPKTLAAGLAAEVAASLPPTDAAALSGPSSDKGKASPKFKGVKKPARSKTPPPSGSSKGSGWLSGISSFIATKMNPEAKVAKLGEQMEAYYDEKTKRWVFPGETASEEPTMPSAPPTGPMPGSAPGSSATGAPPPGANSAPGSMSSGPAPSDDPLAALMAPPPSHMLMKKDPLAAMMAPPARSGMYGARRGGSTAQRKPPRPQFAVFKPSAAPAAAASDEQSEAEVGEKHQLGRHGGTGRPREDLQRAVVAAVDHLLRLVPRLANGLSNDSEAYLTRLQDALHGAAWTTNFHPSALLRYAPL
ncbi:unnamed protein product [Phytophthora fragariaefolia]|uniref:Protein transport protein sec16 n=1 Tax=Phytophthora fragariaefolia TaxID=1490495 RepID=A0A9W7CPY5_9STRA|nr:unnamed protein product [Phytophthora fragariaefolia]